MKKRFHLFIERLRPVIWSLLRPTKRKVIGFFAVALLLGSYMSGYGAGARKVVVPSVLSAQKVGVHKKVEVSSIKFDIDSFELSSQVVIDGKPLRAPADKQFLVIHFYAENTTADTMNLQPVNLFRLVDPQNRRFAPELYNKVTAVAPKSSKQDQVGFLVSSAPTKLSVEFGELGGEKTVISVRK